MSYKIAGREGPIEVRDGEFYFNTKARAKRMIQNSLSSEARRVYACLELATMGFSQELAVKMEKGKKCNLTPQDVSNQTGIDKSHVARAFDELENEGLAKRETDDGGELRRGHIRIYSWAEPHPTAPKIKKVDALGNPPAWFPPSWEHVKPLLSRWKITLSPDFVPPLGYLEDVAEKAREYQERKEVLCALLKSASAPGAYKDERQERHLERQLESSSSSFEGPSLPPENATTTTDPEVPEPNPPELPEPESSPEPDFHSSLKTLFQEAGKPVPLPSQSQAALQALNGDGQAFLQWLAFTRKLRRINHPGALPSLTQEFKEWISAAQPPPLKLQPVAAICPKCRGTGFSDGFAWSLIPEAALHASGGAETCDCDAGQQVRDLAAVG